MRGPARVGGPPAGPRDTEGVERARELHAAAAHIRMLRCGKLDARVGGDRRARLRDDLTVDGDLSGEDERPRAFAGGDEAALEDGDIETSLALGHEIRFSGRRSNRR